MKLTDSGLVKATGSVKMALSDSYTKSDTARARVKISYRFVENDKAGSPAELVLIGDCLESPADEEGYHELLLTRSYQRIDFETAAYSADWSGRLAIIASDLQEVAS
jgi:hypothetical protein